MMALQKPTVYPIHYVIHFTSTFQYFEIQFQYSIEISQDVPTIALAL